MKTVMQLQQTELKNATKWKVIEGFAHFLFLKLFQSGVVRGLLKGRTCRVIISCTLLADKVIEQQVSVPAGL